MLVDTREPLSTCVVIPSLRLDRIPGWAWGAAGLLGGFSVAPLRPSMAVLNAGLGVLRQSFNLPSRSLRWDLEPTSTNLVVPSLPAGRAFPARASGAAVLLSGPPLTVAPLRPLQRPSTRP
jgi:hypothetical protein